MTDPRATCGCGPFKHDCDRKESSPAAKALIKFSIPNCPHQFGGWCYKCVHALLKAEYQRGQTEMYWKDAERKAGREEGFQDGMNAWQIKCSEARQAALEEAAKCLPTNWCDEILSGKDKIDLPWNCPEIEHYTKKLADRIRQLKGER